MSELTSPAHNDRKQHFFSPTLATHMRRRMNALRGRKRTAAIDARIKALGTVADVEAGAPVWRGQQVGAGLKPARRPLPFGETAHLVPDAWAIEMLDTRPLIGRSAGQSHALLNSKSG
jgi:hypothetical protein